MFTITLKFKTKENISRIYFKLKQFASKSTRMANNLCFTKYDPSRLKVIDIGANLSDPMYKGMYNHSSKAVHQGDLDMVLARAYANHVEKIIITGTTLHDCREILELAKTSAPSKLYVTVGCHPTRCDEFEKPGLGNLQNKLFQCSSICINNANFNKFLKIMSMQTFST